MKFLNSLLNLVYPNVCEVCGRTLVRGERLMCLHCLADLPLTNAHREDFVIIHKRLASTVPLERATGYFYYFKNDPYTRLIHSAKYSGRPKLARMLASQFSASLRKEGFFDGIDAVVPVPMHWIKKIRRGYNQSEYVGKGISDVTSLPVVELLRAAKAHRTQTALGGQARWRNLQDVYKTVEGDVGTGYRHVLVVDDVVTTGATLLSCCKALHDKWPDMRISVLVLGVTRLS